MTKTPVQKIQEMLSFLPEKDIVFGNKYLKLRDFESLQLLVKSAIIKVERNLTKENPKEDYLKLDLEKMKALKLEVDEYCNLLGLTNQLEDCEDEFDDYEGGYY